MRIPSEEIKRRYAALREMMAEKELDYLVTGSSARDESRGMLRYFTDYDIPCFEEYLVIPMEGSPVFFAHDGGTKSAMEELAASYEGDAAVQEIRVIPADEFPREPARCVSLYLNEKSQTRGRRLQVGACGLTGLSVRFASSLFETADGLDFVEVDLEVQKIRTVKSPWERERSLEAIRLNEWNFRYYLSLLRPGVREIEALPEAASHACRLGAERQFWLADTGKRPVCRPVPLLRERNHVFQEGDLHAVVLEHAAPGGYFSELSRHISFGKPDREVVYAYEALKSAQEAAFAAMKPGNTVGDVAREAERALKETSFGAWLHTAPPTAMGHSQGLDVWETPRIIRGEETPLLPGLRLNLHPAAALSDGSRVSFCDLYEITEQGAKRLSELPPEVIIVS